MPATTPFTVDTNTERSPILASDEAVGSILVFAPSDASSHYLSFRQATDGLYEELERRGIEVLELFETLDIPARDEVASPDVSQALRKRYSIPAGTMTLLVLTDVGERPRLRIEGDVTRTGFLEKIDSLGGKSK